MKQVLGVLILLLALTACTSAERGDKVYVTYTGSYTNGTIFDTNDPDLLTAVNKPASAFTPLIVTLGRGQVVPGFEAALYDMRKGQSKQVTIKAKEAYGAYDASLVASVPKRFIVPYTFELERELAVPKPEVQGEIAIGELVTTENFVYNVTGQNSTHVMLYALNVTNDPITFPDTYWSSKLTRSTQDLFYYKNDIKNKTYSTDFGPFVPEGNGTHYVFTTTLAVGQEYRAAGGIGRVTRESDTSVYIDFNHPLAGHDLVFNITIDEIERP